MGRIIHALALGSSTRKMAAFMRAKILYFMVNLIQINLSKMTDGNIVTSMTDWVLPLGLAGISLIPLMGLG